MVEIKSFVEYISENKNPPIASVTGPTVNINADYKSGQSLPNWNGLTSEEKKLFWDKGPIGRRIRLKAGMKYPDLITSDGLHQVADILALGLDFIFPPASSLIDILNGVSYAVEASLKGNKEEQNTYYLLSLISFAFAAAPGPLQAGAIPLKAAIKSGKRVDKSFILGFINKIATKIDEIFEKLLKMIDDFVNYDPWDTPGGPLTKMIRIWLNYLKSRKVYSSDPEFLERYKKVFKNSMELEKKLFALQVKRYIEKLGNHIQWYTQRHPIPSLKDLEKDINNLEELMKSNSSSHYLSKDKGIRMSGNLK